jgi:ABC-type multidrug transport system ATPase subunit
LSSGSAATQSHPIEFEGVTKRYGSHTVLNDLTFFVPEATVVGLLGPNGAGKSTAMRVLLGLQRPEAGVARINGHAPGTSGFRAAVRQVGAIIESPPLYKNATPYENLAIRLTAIGQKVDGVRINRMIEQVGLGQQAGDNVARFSLGMRQRVGLALALVGDPAIAVLDEPTNGLDPQGSVEIRDLVKRLPERGTTTLICTHRLDEIEKTCDYVVVLRDGQLITEGTLSEVIAMASHRGHTVLVPPAQISQAVQTLTGLGLEGVAVVDGAIVTKTQLDDPGRITYALATKGIFLRGLETSHASLEDAFLEITREKGI